MRCHNRGSQERSMLPAGLIAERRLIQRLLQSNAVAPGEAQPLADLRRAEQSRLARLVGAGVVREAPPGRYYLSAPALGEYWFGVRRNRAIIIVALVVAALAVVALAMVAPR
jgi:hypothetical protein